MLPNYCKMVLTCFAILYYKLIILFKEQCHESGQIALC